MGPSPDKAQVISDPLPAIVYSSNVSLPTFFLSTLGYNMIVHLTLLLFSVLHLGLGAMAFLLIRCFYLGASIAWFARFPATSVANGVFAYASHGILELAAGSLIAASSIWISLSVLKPERELSRWATIKKRYHEAIPVIPVVIALLIMGAILEGTVSLSLAKDYAQIALTSEDTRIWSDSSDGWSMSIPASWQKIDISQSPGLHVNGVAGYSVPLIIDVRVSRQNGTFPWKNYSAGLAVGIEKSLTEQGYKVTGASKEVMINGVPAIKTVASGNDITLKSRKMVATTYLEAKTDQTTDSTITYAIYVRTEPDWINFLQPLIDKYVQTFDLDNNTVL